MLAELIGEEYGEMLELLAIVREKLLTLGMPEAYNVQLVKNYWPRGLPVYCAKADKGKPKL